MKESGNKSSRGGARRGAGRKKDSTLGKYYGFRSTLEVQDILERIDRGKSEYINKAIMEYSKPKETVQAECRQLSALE